MWTGVLVVVGCLVMVFGAPEWVRQDLDSQGGGSSGTSNTKRSIGQSGDLEEYLKTLDNENNNDKRSVDNEGQGAADKRSMDDGLQTAIDKRSMDNDVQMAVEKRGKKGKSKSSKAGKGGKSKGNTKNLVPGSIQEAIDMDISGVALPGRTSTDDQEKALQIHKDYRRVEDAENMWDIVYDKSLEELAQGIVDSCVFKHTNLRFENGTQVGQNLGVAAGGQFPIEKVLHLFHEERKDYNLDTMSYTHFVKVGHYLQMVYWDTMKVGCAKNRCAKLYLPLSNRVWEDADYWACDYWPPLSISGPPFQKGKRCKQCHLPMDSEYGWQCLNNLCETCTKGSKGCHDPVQCDASLITPDINKETCLKMKAKGECSFKSEKFQRMRKACATTCNICPEIPDAVLPQ